MSDYPIQPSPPHELTTETPAANPPFYHISLQRVELTDLPDNIQDRSCDICRAPYGSIESDTQEHEFPVRLACNHVFGHLCIQEWIRGGATPSSNLNCPACRRKIELTIRPSTPRGPSQEAPRNHNATRIPPTPRLDDIRTRTRTRTSREVSRDENGWRIRFPTPGIEEGDYENHNRNRWQHIRNRHDNAARDVALANELSTPEARLSLQPDHSALLDVPIVRLGDHMEQGYLSAFAERKLFLHLQARGVFQPPQIGATYRATRIISDEDLYEELRNRGAHWTMRWGWMRYGTRMFGDRLTPDERREYLEYHRRTSVRIFWGRPRLIDRDLDAYARLHDLD